MDKKLKLALIILVPVFLLFLIINVTLNNFLSEDRLKAMIIVPTQNELGRDLTIGSAKVSLFSGITITDIGIKERNSSEDFITVKTFRLSYEILPLFQKKLVIKEVLIDEPKIRIIRSDDGNFNFSSIGQKEKSKSEEVVPVEDNIDVESEPLPFTLSFDRVNINKAIITLTDHNDILPEVHSEVDLTMSVQLGEVFADTEFDGSLNILATGKYRGHKPVLQVSCDITEEIISYKGLLTVGFDKLEVEGWTGNYLSRPDTELNLDINSLDLDKLASLKQFIEDETDNIPLENSEPVKQPEKIDANNDKPVDLKLSAHGTVHISKISSGLIKMQEVVLAYQLKDNILSLNELKAFIFDGSINGEITADISKKAPVFDGKISCEEIKVSEIMVALDKPPEVFTGELASSFTFNGNGMGLPVIQKNLNGEGNFAILDGAIQETPLTTGIATVIGNQDLSDLSFRDFSGKFTVADGKVSLYSNLQSQNINIQATGNIGLDGSLDMPLTLQLSEEYSKNSTITKYLSDDQGRATIQLNASGSIQNPKITIDSEEVKGQAAKVVKKKILEKLSTQDSGKVISGTLLNQFLGN